MSHMNNIPRSEKLTIAHKIHDNLVDRQAHGPPEPGLDAFIPQVSEIIVRLDTHVTGNVAANAAREQQLARVETADIEVDTWLRHIEGFLYVEANRRAGPNVIACKAVYKAACPDGLAHVDARVPEENAHCRKMLSVLRDPVNAATLAAIKLPVVWLDNFEDALTESEAAVNDTSEARNDKSVHVELGRDAEADWADLMHRIQHYVGSRASRGEVEKRAEGQTLILPLRAAIQKLHADASARVTRKAKAKAAKAPSNSPAQPEAPSNSPAQPQ
jgi:hypothetical protein